MIKEFSFVGENMTFTYNENYFKYDLLNLICIEINSMEPLGHSLVKAQMRELTKSDHPDWVV